MKVRLRSLRLIGILFAVATALGCNVSTEMASLPSEHDSPPGESLTLPSTQESLAAQPEKLAFDTPESPQTIEERRERPPSLTLPIRGLWLPSGWMGDAANTSGVLTYRTCVEPLPGQPVSDEWGYDPSQGALGWAAVAYQFPENNWGDLPGKDLSNQGITRLTFFAKGLRGGEHVIFKSGGCTQRDARHPASYETSIGSVTLTSAWKQYSIPLRQGNDLSNTAAALVIVLRRDLTPEGCTIRIRDAVLRGPETALGK